MTTHTWLVILPSDQCKRRLAEATLGRLAVIVDGRPEIYPINHAYDHDTSTVAFPTNTGTKLHGALHWPWVTFEVDGLEDNDTSGWSVLVTGHAEQITAADDIARLAHQRTAPWRAGHTARWIRIIPTEITSRQIRGPKG